MFRSSSLTTSSHRTLIVLGTFAALGLLLALAIGWSAFFQERDKRVLMSRLAVAATQRATLMAAQRELDTPAVPAARPKVAAPSAPKTPALQDMAQDDVSHDLAPLVRVAGPVEPDALAAASAVLQTFWRAASWTDKLPCVDSAQRVQPLMQAHYATQRNKDPISGALIRTGRYRLNSRDMLILTYASSQPGNELDVILLAGADGRYLLDWESYVGWGNMTFQDFKKQRPASPQLMRVHARRDEAYQGEFANPALYLGLELISPDGLYYFHGYCEKNSPTGLALAGAITGGALVKLTLRLAYPAESQSADTVHITGLVADRWLVMR